MDKINIAGFYLLGTRIQPLLTIKAGMSIGDLVSLLADADEFLDLLLNVSEGPKVEESRPLAEELQKTLERITVLPARIAKHGIVFPTGKIINEREASAITRLVKAFEAVFCSEMPKKGIFYVTAKRAYSTELLLNSAEKVLDGKDLDYLVEETKYDIRGAGSCLLFDQFTASGFHAARAIEGIARRYYELVTGQRATEDGTEHGRPLNLWGLIAQLTRRLNTITPKPELGSLIISLLDGMRIIYRNPIMHPEVELKETDAARLFNLMIDAISHIIADIRDGGPHFSALWGIHF